MQSNICPNNSDKTLHCGAEGRQWHVGQYSVVSQCEGQDFKLLCPSSPTLQLWLLQLIATKPEQNLRAGKLASYSFQLLHRPLSA
jgi:hypothetical protein